MRKYRGWRFIDYVRFKRAYHYYMYHEIRYGLWELVAEVVYDMDPMATLIEEECLRERHPWPAKSIIEQRSKRYAGH